MPDWPLLAAAARGCLNPLPPPLRPPPAEGRIPGFPGARTEEQGEVREDERPGVPLVRERAHEAPHGLRHGPRPGRPQRLRGRQRREAPGVGQAEKLRVRDGRGDEEEEGEEVERLAEEDPGGGAGGGRGVERLRRRAASGENVSE